MITLIITFVFMYLAYLIWMKKPLGDFILWIKYGRHRRK